MGDKLEAKFKKLEFYQNIISRMSANSMQKGRQLQINHKVSINSFNEILNLQNLINEVE